MASDLYVLLPVLTVALTALVIVVVDWFVPPGDPRPPAALALVGLATAGLTLGLAWNAPDVSAFVRPATPADGAVAEVGWIWRDHYGTFAGAILVLTAAGTVLFALDYARRHPGLARAELHATLLFATAAMMLTAMANDLVLVFLGIETFSIALYILAGFLRDERPSQEAALKYFVLGAFAAGFLLYGIALTYASAGTTNLVRLHDALAGREHSLPGMTHVALALILVGLGFKIAMVPFHQWTPDVYEGAPTPVTAFMAAATKTAAFAALARVLWVGFAPLASTWVPLVGMLAVVTMVVGNLAALVQADLKRMLAYSAVAHAGYLLAAVAAGPSAGTSAMLVYLLVYAVMNLGAFGALVALGGAGAGGRDVTTLDDLRGLGARHAGLATALAICLFALTGLPPTAGFLAKWYVFDAAVGVGLVWLAAAIVLNSVVSAFYYLRPVVYMLLAEPADRAPLAAARASGAVVAVAAAAILLALVAAAPFAAGVRDALMAGAVVP